MNNQELISEMNGIVNKMQFQEEIEYAISKIDMLIQKTESQNSNV